MRVILRDTKGNYLWCIVPEDPRSEDPKPLVPQTVLYTCTLAMDADSLALFKDSDGLRTKTLAERQKIAEAVMQMPEASWVRGRTKLGLAITGSMGFKETKNTMWLRVGVRNPVTSKCIPDWHDITERFVVHTDDYVPHLQKASTT